MDPQTEELIALAASCAANCVPCLEYHLPKARENGAAVDQIEEALRIARMVKTNASRKWDGRAAALLGSESNAVAECPARPGI